MAKQNDGSITPLRRFIIVTAISLGGVMGIVATATVLAATPRQEPQPNQTSPTNPTNQTNTATTARAQILHLAPFTGTLSSTAVTIVISNAMNTVSLTDVVFGQTSNGYLDIEADIPTQIEIIPSGETTPVLTSILTLTAGVDYSIAAVGGSNGYPLELLTLIDDNTPPATRQQQAACRPRGAIHRHTRRHACGYTP
ncbi:MAG: DUF4397 domain-containing protein [Chloroflexi bacterium]|nr:DUF4397 domain-containing protein [Chloroflexota bacterium]